MHKVILADDHKILREGLKTLIEKDNVFQVAAQASDGEELLELLAKRKVDLIVLDLCMPQMDGMEALRMIHKQYPKLKILILTMQKDQEHFKKAMKHGAHGYVLKEDAYEQLVMAMKMIMQGKRFVSAAISGLITEQYVRSLDETENSSLDILTKRELQILKMIAAGHPNKAVALKLNLSVRTVETHRANFIKKLGVKNVSQLVRYAVSKGLI